MSPGELSAVCVCVCIYTVHHPLPQLDLTDALKMLCHASPGNVHHPRFIYMPCALCYMLCVLAPHRIPPSASLRLSILPSHFQVIYESSAWRQCFLGIQIYQDFS